jgi:hypothetical protein
MKLLLGIGLICSLFLLVSGCGTSGSQHPKAGPSGGTHEEARQIVMDYVNQYEQLYLQEHDPEIRKRLSQVTQDYRTRMSYLTEKGKWTPSQEMGKAIKLSFLIGQFHGSLQSCKVERAQPDATTVGCDEVQRLKDAIEALCSE